MVNFSIIDLNNDETDVTRIKCSKSKQDKYYLYKDKDGIMVQIATDSLSWKQQSRIIDGKEVQNKYFNPLKDPLKGEITLSPDTMPLITNFTKHIKSIIDNSGIKLGKKNEFKDLYKTYPTKNGDKSSMDVTLITSYEKDASNFDQVTTIIKLAYNSEIKRLEITTKDTKNNESSKYILISSISADIMKIIEANYNGCCKWGDNNYYDFEDYKEYLTPEQIKTVENLISEKGEVFDKYNTLSSIKELIRYNTQIVTILQPGAVYVESYYGISLKLFKILILTQPQVRNSSRVDFVNINKKKVSTILSDDSDHETKPVKNTKKEVEIDSDSDEPKLQQVKSTKKVSVPVDSESDDPKPLKPKVTKKVAQVESDGSDSEPHLQPVKVTKKPTKKVAQVESDGSDSEHEPVKITTKTKSKK